MLSRRAAVIDLGRSGDLTRAVRTMETLDGVIRAVIAEYAAGAEFEALDRRLRPVAGRSCQCARGLNSHDGGGCKDDREVPHDTFLFFSLKFPSNFVSFDKLEIVVGTYLFKGIFGKESGWLIFCFREFLSGIFCLIPMC